MNLVRIAVILLFATFASLAHAQDPNVTAAKVAVDSWLQLQDTAKYSASWEQASALLRAGVTEQDWEAALAKYRSPFGAVKSRHLKSAQFTRTLPAAPPGEYVVMQYETNFESGATVVETITPQRIRRRMESLRLFYKVAFGTSGVNRAAA